jgi:hypothetical protein
MQPQYPTAPQYPQQPQTYPQPAYPQQPQGYPQQPQAYAPPMQQQGYPQAYPQQYAPPAPPAAPLPTGSLDTFYQQPSTSGGPSFKFQDANRQPQIGKTYAGFVARPVTDADVRAQTNNGQVITFTDGRPKFVLVVPMQVQPSEEFPDGQAGWWVKGQARDELARAMDAAGAPAGAPESGAFIQVTLVGTRPIPGKNPAFQYRVEYQRPQGAQQAAPVQQAAPQQAPPPVQQPAPQPVYQQAPMPQPAPVQVAPQPQPALQVAPQPAAAPAPQAAPAGFNAEQAALFAKLTGQPTG